MYLRVKINHILSFFICWKLKSLYDIYMHFPLPQMVNNSTRYSIGITNAKLKRRKQGFHKRSTLQKCCSKYIKTYFKMSESSQILMCNSFHQETKCYKKVIKNTYNYNKIFSVSSLNLRAAIVPCTKCYQIDM